MHETASIFGFWVSDLRFRVSGFGFRYTARVSDFGVRVFGFLGEGGELR